MKSYEYQTAHDTRPLDVWGKPIGKPYQKKDWNELSPEEMMADFDWKNDILAAAGELVDCDTFYQDYLFRELYEKSLSGDYKVVLTEYDAQAGNKIHKIDVDDISDYLNLSDVALSPCLFYSNWRNKRLLNYVSAFVLDIDRLRPEQLRRFLNLFDQERLLRPTFIANSGSGVHFYYLLDKMLRVDAGTHEANNLIADQIYKKLYDDVIKEEKWKDAQRHWIGQDYRVVNSKTKLHQTAQIFKIGDVYRVEQLTLHYNIKIDQKKPYASKSMIKYATNIAKDLQIAPPDFENSKATYEFIKNNKDAAYVIRSEKRMKKQKNKKKSKKTVTWYKNTLYRMQDHTNAGFRFSSMKALAVIAFKEKVPREVFKADIEALSGYWASYDWKGDNFNIANVEAIERLYNNAEKYRNTSSETLEEWLGYEFRRIGVKRNGRNRTDHIKLMNYVRDEINGNKDWRNKDGRPTLQERVLQYKTEHPGAKPVDCIRETGISKNTVYKWWK